MRNHQSLHCAACDKPVPPESVRYTMFLRSPQQFQGTTAAHLCDECGHNALRVFAMNLRETRKVTRA